MIRSKSLLVFVLLAGLTSDRAASHPSTTAPAQAPQPAPQASAPARNETADEWAARARLLHKKGSIFEALDAMEKATRIDPSRADIRMEYADLLRTTGFWLRGAAEYKAVLELRPDSVDAHLGYGELLMAEYQFAAAARQFSEALRLKPDPLDREHAMVGLGTARYALDDFEGAAKSFGEVLSVNPDSLTAIAYQALAKRKLGDLDEALRLLGRFLEIQPAASRPKIQRIEFEELRAAIEQARANVQNDPTNAAAWAALGRLLRRKPDLAGAVEAYAAAARLSPSTPAYRFGLGAVQRDMGRVRQAYESFTGVGRDESLGALAAYNAAYCARRAGDRDNELKAWRMALDLNPRDMYAYRHYARNLASSGGLRRELLMMKEAAGEAVKSGGTRDALPTIRLAILSEADGDREAARSAALDAMRLDMNDVHAQKVVRNLLTLDGAAVRKALDETEAAKDGSGIRAALMIVLNRAADAKPEAGLRKMVDAAPKDARPRVALAYYLKGVGRRDEAISELQAARDAEPSYLYAHLDLGLALLETNRPDAAIAAAREAVRLAPDNPIGYTLLGTALREKGDLVKAASALERAVSIDPMDDEGAPRLLLAKLYGALGRNDDARETLKGDLPEDPDEIYRTAWEFVRDTYADRGFRGQDWSSWENRFKGKLQSTPEALGAVALMLSSLNDRNTRLRAPDQTANLLFTQRTDAPEFSRATGAALSTSKTVESRRLEGNVGYIAITNLDDPKLPGEMQKAVEQMKTSDGVILDLRGNQGGSDGDVPRIAGMFMKPGTETGTVVQPEGTMKSKAEPATADGKPILPQDKPVVVLVDRNTASSAENLAGSLKESKRALLVGEKTYGKSGIQIPKLLPGGAIVLVVGGEHADLKGSIYTGVGIKPDVTVDGASSGDRSPEDPAMKKARELLKQKKPGS